MARQRSEDQHGLGHLLGYAAAASVLATFCIRILALVSNVLFCLYGYLDDLAPVLILHSSCFR